MLLEADRISRSFCGPQGDVPAVCDLSLQLDAGQFTAVCGPSGCGKSTLLLMAGGLLRPDSGQIRIGGCDPYALSSSERTALRAAQIGFVFQQFHLVPYLNVLENVMAPAIAMPSARACSRARELLERFGMEHRLTHLPSQLSSGERQRAAMARALLNRPKLILADEPTGNLDRENSDIILSQLTEFAQQGGSVLLVTHDIPAAERASQILQMQCGRIVRG